MSKFTLGDISNADGLDEKEREALFLLVQVYQKNLARNQERMSYYRGETKVKNLGIAVPDHFNNLDISCCWPQKTVEVLQSRSVFDGFVSSDGTVDETLQRISLENDLSAKYSRAVIPQLVHGCAFATVMRKENGKASIRFRTAEHAAALWNGEKDRIGCGFVIVDSKRFQDDTTYQPCLVHYHTDDAVWVLTRETKEGQWKAKRLDNPAGRPLMEPLVYRPTEDKPFGQSRITKPVMSLTDSYMREMLRMEVGAELFTSPQKVIMGADDAAFEMDKFNAYITSILTIGKDEDGDVPSITQLSAASMQPHIDVMRNLAAQFAGATCVPVSELGVIHDNPSSAEAIYAAKEALIVEVDTSLNAGNAKALKNIALMAIAIESNKPLDKLTDEERDIEPKFKNPAMPSIVSQADAMTKIASTASWIAETSVYLEELGFDEATRRRMLAEKDKLQAKQAITSLMSKKVSENDTAQPVG